MTPKTRRDAETLIIDKADQDPDYRKRLLGDPKGVISQELGISLPEGYKINVVEETDHAIYLVLPARRPAKGELADSDLDQVAGGQRSSKGGKQAPKPQPRPGR